MVRALMLLRLSTLATGRTGARPSTAETYAALLSAGITPVVHELGSLDCSGDLAALAHVAMALMGEGEVRGADEVLCPATDGTGLAARTLARVLTDDPGTGVVRRVDAGYDRTDEVAAERGVRVPMRDG